MDLGLLIAIAFAMMLLTFAVQKLLGQNIAAAIGFIATLSVVLPMVLIALFGMAKMLSADPGTTEEIAALTIEAIVGYFTNQLPGIIISDAIGIILGSVGNFFTSQR